MTSLSILYRNQSVLIAQTYVNDECIYADNMGLHVGDDPQIVLGRRADLLQALQPYKIDTITWLNQVHGDVVIDVDINTKCLIESVCADAQFTQNRHHALAIMTADCVPVAVFDDKYVACIHAGWQGLVQGIIPRTLSQLTNSTKFAYIGACISGANYELPKPMAIQILDQCVADKLVTVSQDELYQSVIVKSDDNKAYLDVGRLARVQLMSYGVHVLNDAIACTYDGNFHSHRRATHQGVKSGRMAMVIARL